MKILSMLCCTSTSAVIPQTIRPNNITQITNEQALMFSVNNMRIENSLITARMQERLEQQAQRAIAARMHDNSEVS